ncbi:MAG TPA: folylpolyglutamate synthase/dihydrofolate synthase family protein [Ornithinicoccus sp.]|nr:folylpolyglutamate synthase/dihydrofolate synthase family protein [Ornithinicoccus sp.]
MTADPAIEARMAQVTADILARSPENVVEPTLDRVAQVMDLLGHPQRNFPTIHLTGTNGKTSTTRMIERLLREMGLKTGRFTSPHLHDMRERISIAGEPVSAERFLSAYDDVMPFVQMVDETSVAAGGPRITYFELLAIVAYAVFSDAPVDVAVVEVGLGGVWDATNVADGSVAVVTPIAIDHTRLLGDNLIDIATEKAGIVKSDAIAVLGVQENEVMQLLLERADEVGASAQVEGLAFGVLEREVAVGGQLLSVRGLAGDYTDVFLPVFGGFQAHNAALAIAAVEAFVGGGEQPLDQDVVRAAFADVTSPGRLEVVRRSPTVLVDAAHNPAGVAAMAEAVRESFTFHRLVGVVAVLQEKDAEAMLEQLEPLLDHIVVSRSSSPRAIRPARLGEMAVELFGEDRVTVVENLPDALDLAAGLADEGGMSGAVLATGSITTVADVRMLLGANRPEDQHS